MPDKFMDTYVRADFIALVSITKNYPNPDSSFYYDSNIKIERLFKGENIRSVLIEGSSDGKIRTSCDLFFPEGTKMIMYANRDGAGKYRVNACSEYLILPSINTRQEKRALEMLDFLNRRQLNTSDKVIYGSDIYDQLLPLRGIEAPRSFAIYEITFSENLRVDTVSTIMGFNPELDSRLIKILHEVKWSGEWDPSKTKMFFGFYYYNKQGQDPSFISVWDL